MFDPAAWSRLEGLLFTARTLVDGLYAGGHASPRQGGGIEFHDYRPYVPGDDLSAVDWKLFGRTDRHYLRRYQRYSELPVQLLIDASASMNFASLDPSIEEGQRTKLAVAKELAAAIAFLTVRQGDRVGLALGGSRLREVIPIQGGWPHLLRLCATLERATADAKGEAGDMAACLRQVLAMRRRRGMVVLVSDLLDEPGPVMDALARLRHERLEVIVMQVLAPAELNLAQQRNDAAAGDSKGRWWRLVDAESPQAVEVRLPGGAAAYDQRMKAHLSTLRRGCEARGVSYGLVRTDRPVLESLRQYLAHLARHGS